MWVCGSVIRCTIEPRSSIPRCASVTTVGVLGGYLFLPILVFWVVRVAGIGRGCLYSFLDSGINTTGLEKIKGMDMDLVAMWRQ